MLEVKRTIVSCSWSYTFCTSWWKRYFIWFRSWNHTRNGWWANGNCVRFGALFSIPSRGRRWNGRLLPLWFVY
jgi:hypothetical protein